MRSRQAGIHLMRQYTLAVKKTIQKEQIRFPRSIHTMVAMGGDLRLGSLADRLLPGLNQPQLSP